MTCLVDESDPTGWKITVCLGKMELTQCATAAGALIQRQASALLSRCFLNSENCTAPHPSSQQALPMAEGLGWEGGRDTLCYPPTARETNPLSAGSEERSDQPPPRGISSWQGLACCSGDLSGYLEEHVRQGRPEDIPDLPRKGEQLLQAA